MQIDPEDILVCPACNGEFFIVVYHLALPKGCVDTGKKAQAYHCVTCKQTFPTNEVKPRRDAGQVLDVMSGKRMTP